jgi:hypothetical protein
MAPSHDSLLGTRAQRAYAPGGRTPWGERDWRSWPCDSCIASPLFVALDLHGTAGSPERLRTAFIPLSCPSPAPARHALTVCGSARAGLGAVRRWPRADLLAKPSTPFSRNRFAHL